MKTKTASKIRGMFLGIAIGDALGAPVEMYSAQKIRDIHGKIEYYINPTGHKYHDGRPIGFTTDDTQLTLAVAKALSVAKRFDMDAIVKEHVKALECCVGWGGTTRRAVERLKKGSHWSKSGIEETEEDVDPRIVTGCGNGIPMKITPVAAWHFLTKQSYDPYSELLDFGAMTHYTDMAVLSGVIHFDAIIHCLNIEDPCKFTPQYFCEDVTVGVDDAKLLKFEPRLRHINDNIISRLEQLFRIIQHKSIDDRNRVWSDHTIRSIFGTGGCYVYDSLPFSYAYFLRNPHSFQCVVDCVNAGGDTDSTASIVGGLLGALNGDTVFPQELIADLHGRDELEVIVDEFIENFS